MSSSFYNSLVKEINLVRKSPPSYADKVLGYKKYFKGNILKLPNSKAGVQTEEGFAAYENAAKFLKNAKPIEDMVPSKALSRIANDYLEKIKNCDPDKIGEIDIDLIIKKYGSFTGTFNNVMDFGSASPELVVISLLVSDGDETRSNREFIFNPELKKVGIASGAHQTYGNCTIIISCTNFQNTVDKDDNETYGGLYKNEPKTLSSTTSSEKAPEKDSKEIDEIIINDPNVVSWEKRERFVVERGKKKKKIVLMKKYKDGKIKKEVKYILL